MPIPIYTGSGFDAKNSEYYDFIGRPVRNIRVINQDPDEPELNEYKFELYISELKKWRVVIGPEEPQLVGTVSDLDEHPQTLGIEEAQILTKPSGPLNSYGARAWPRESPNDPWDQDAWQNEQREGPWNEEQALKDEAFKVLGKGYLVGRGPFPSAIIKEFRKVMAGLYHLQGKIFTNTLLDDEEWEDDEDMGALEKAYFLAINDKLTGISLNQFMPMWWLIEYD